MEFTEALTRAYLDNPCQTLPNPLWKTLDRLEGCQASFAAGPGGEPTHLELWRGRQFLLYWDADRRHFEPVQGRLEESTFALVHQDYLAWMRLENFSQRTAYFRLSWHVDAQRPAPALPEDFCFRNVAVEGEAGAVSELIRGCYEHIAPTSETVSGWSRSRVFTPDLWVWAWDKARQRPAGLGIAEADARVGEGALEWIQVLPAYRGRGLGAALTLELLRRMRGRVASVTVSGEVENATAPERLYRRCGFSGQDVWWVLRRELPLASVL